MNLDNQIGALVRNAAGTQITSRRTRCVARCVDDATDTWVVSWLAGEWTRSQASAAMSVAELMLVPEMGSGRWRSTVGALLADLGVGWSALLPLIDEIKEV